MKKLLLFFLSFLSLPLCYGAQGLNFVGNASMWTSLVKKCSTAQRQIQSLVEHTYHSLAHTTWNPTILKKLGGYIAIASVAVYGTYKLSQLLHTKKHSKKTSSDTPHANTTQTSMQRVKEEDIAPDKAAPKEPTKQEQPTQEAATSSVQTEYHDEPLPVIPYFSVPEHHVIEPIVFDNEQTHSHITVQQLRVLSQDTTDQHNHCIGGGNFSCGYHASTKNALALAGIVQGFDTEAVFNSQAIVTYLFDPVKIGYLRKYIIDMRKKVSLKYLLQNTIQIVLPEPIDKQENTKILYTLYKCMVNEYLNSIINQALDTNSSIYKVPSDIMQDLQTMPFKISDATAKEINCTPEHLYKFLHQQENLQRYIRIISPVEIIQETPINALHYYNAVYANRLDEQGELLNSDEMEQLINYYRQTDELARQVLDPHHVQVIILESADPRMWNLIDSIKKLKDTIQSGQPMASTRYIFILGNTNQEAKNNGHWLTLLLECSGNERRYTITNSSGNHICLFDDPLHHNNPCFNIIRYFEGDCAVRHLQPSTLYKDTLLAQLLSDIDQCKMHTKDPYCLEKVQNSHALYDTYVGDYSFHTRGREGFLHELEELIEHCIR
jgi:hypothetical protein